MNNPLADMLLIKESSILKLYDEYFKLASVFLTPAFILALVIEYFSEWNFPEVVKKLVIIVIFMSFFHVVHTKAVNVSLDTAYFTLKKVDPSNPFVRKWYHPKIKTTEDKSWGIFQKIVIPNLNDLIGTAFYLLVRVCVWVLKLVYSTVFHLTYIFAPLSAVLFFFNWTNKGLVGTIQSSLWCIIMPFVVVAIFALVGNGLNDRAENSEIVAGDIDTIIWLFGVSLVLLISPLITWGMVKGEGVASGASHIGKMAMKGITTTAVASTMLKSTYGNVRRLIPSSPYKRKEEVEE